MRDLQPIFFGQKKKQHEVVFKNWKKNFNCKNKIKLIDRLNSEKEYNNNKKAEWISQEEIYKYPNYQILIGISKSLRNLYLNSKIKLGDIASGGTGISTGNDRKFLRKTTIAKNDRNWVPYFKNASRQKYYYRPTFSIEKNYKKYYKKISNYLIRNEKFFFKEGISCSSVGVRFSAAYMPEKCLFGVNANFFFKNRDDLFYILAFLNTKIAWYFSRKILIRTNNISANYLRKMPIIFPNSKMQKKYIVKNVKKTINQLCKNPNYDFSKFENEMNDVFYSIYKINDLDKQKIERFTKNFYDEM